MKEDLKVGQHVLVSATATGLGAPIPAYIDKIEHYNGQILVSVTYASPNPLPGLGGCYYSQYIKRYPHNE